MDVSSPSWLALLAHRERIRSTPIRDLFAADTERFARFSRTIPARSHSAPGLLFDFSKNRITSETLTLLLDLARASRVEAARDALFAGEAINWTEDRPVLHTALRNRSNRPVMVAGRNVMPKVNRTLERMESFSRAVRSAGMAGGATWTIRTVVNIGIGGSHLGPEMICEALSASVADGPAVRFVANVDGHAFAEATRGLNPRETLFIISSKTFTTRETMRNAASARTWFLANGGEPERLKHHFAAVTANHAAAEAFGIDPAWIFPMWNWVGGRYSWCSAIGLPVACRIGFAHFSALLDGAHALDNHFRSAPLAENMPVLMALIGLWNRNLLGAGSLAILPYAEALHRFPAFLQQAEMESNGKRIDRRGAVVGHDTCPVIWGEPGTNGQHSFFQMLHQGTTVIPADFIGFVQAPPVSGLSGGDKHHVELMANFFAQSEALMVGRSEAAARQEMARAGLAPERIDALLPHRVFPGNRPSNTLLLDRLTPYALGMLIALYEMKIFVQGVLWGINSFDQWGVELGKNLARRIRTEIDAGPGADLSGHDGSTRGLLDYFRARR